RPWPRRRRGAAGPDPPTPWAQAGRAAQIRRRTWPTRRRRGNARAWAAWARSLCPRAGRGASRRSRARGPPAAPPACAPAPPPAGALAWSPVVRGADPVGGMAEPLALAGDAGEPAGAGEHGKQRQLGQRDRRGTVVDQHDVIGCERQLVATARGGAVDHANGE